MIKIDFYKPENFSELNHDLDQIQIQFTVTMRLALERLAERNSNNDFFAKPITIFYEGKPVGFSVIDFGEDKMELSENKNCVLVRSLSVNQKF